MTSDIVNPTSFITVDHEVADAIGRDQPIVALESTIFSTLGLPAPHNRNALEACHQTVRDHGAIPAMTAILDGTIHVGVAPHDWDRILASTTKIAARDIGPAVAAGCEVGVTTVSAAVTIASLVGIHVFATGGIGGVHRDVEHSGDVSADLDTITEHPGGPGRHGEEGDRCELPAPSEPASPSTTS